MKKELTLKLTKKSEFETVSIHGHEYFDEKLGVFIPPIYVAAMFEQPGWTRKSDRGLDLKYAREENPTSRALEHVLAKLDLGDDALCFSSGMAAISTVYFSILSSGDKVVIPREAYGMSIKLAQDLSKYGVEAVIPWPETDDIVDDIKKGVKLVAVETITNPTLRVLDIPKIAEKCKEVGATLVVDNTFASPVLYQPLKDGVNLVVHSVTKYLGGHNDVIAGAIIGSKDDIKGLWNWRREIGNILGPFEAYLVLRGVKTLKIRVEKSCTNAQKIAEFLSSHPKVKGVHYPGLSRDKYHGVAKKLFKGGFGGVVSFNIKGEQEEVIKLMKQLKVVKAAPSLGGTESLLSYPVIGASGTMPEDVRKTLGITADLVRLSVGIENTDDLIYDLDQALNSI